MGCEVGGKAGPIAEAIPTIYRPLSGCTPQDAGHRLRADTVVVDSSVNVQWVRHAGSRRGKHGSA